MKNFTIFLLIHSLVHMTAYAEGDAVVKNAKYVFLAGGSGERLWPLSRKDRPKQLIPFLGNQSLLEQTIERIEPLAPVQKNKIVLTNSVQHAGVTSLVGNRIGSVMVEPASRNTAPAILYACTQFDVQEQDPVLVFLPSDHFIPDSPAFCKVIQKSIDYAQNHDDIVLIGLMPTFPATGYGYIQTDVKPGINHYRVLKFHEKPNLETAEQYIRRDDMFWNIGIFIARQSVLLNNFQEYAPELFFGMQQCLLGQKAFETLPNISIDYAVMEKSSHIVMMPADFEWYDVGNIKTFLDIKARYGKEDDHVITYDGQGNSASTSKKVVACVGVSDLCIVETEDVILVVAKDRVEQVKKILEKIKG